jgi:flagellar M-ring protein FliF
VPEFVTKFFKQIVNLWNNLEKSQKTRIYITTAIVVVFVSIGMILLTRPNYIVLVNEADSNQIGEMSGILNENNIWNRIENNGQSIVINSKDNNIAQVALAQKGFPKDGLTFEDAISLIGIGTSESDKKKIWKQQQTSDISSKIKMLDNIKDAYVSLAVPETSVFITSYREQPSSSAIVMVEPEGKLSSKQVEGIVMIVSRSVENLDPGDITVVDNNSNILNRGIYDESIEIASTQEEMLKKKSIELQDRIYEYFGIAQFDNFDAIRVVVNPVIDFDKISTKSKNITNPDGMREGALISADRLEENLVNGSINGIPGTDTNPGDTSIPSYQTGDNSNSTYSKNHEIENYAYDEELIEHERATGKFVSEETTAAVALWWGKRVTDETKLSNEFIDQIKLAVSNAIGIPVKNITINKFKLAPEEEVKKPAAESLREIIENYGFFIILFILIIGLVIVTYPKKKKEIAGETATLETAEEMISKFNVPKHEEEFIPELELEEKSEIKRQIEKIIKQKPQAVAELLRNWLKDEWDT